MRAQKMLKKEIIGAEERIERRESEERKIVQSYHNTTSKFSTSRYENFWFLNKRANNDSK